MLKFLSITNQAISWLVGRGIQVFVGIDPVVELSNNFILSQELIIALHEKNVYILKQVYCAQKFGSSWLRSVDLQLSENVAEEWDFCVASLY